MVVDGAKIGEQQNSWGKIWFKLAMVNEIERELLKRKFSQLLGGRATNFVYASHIRKMKESLEALGAGFLLIKIQI